MSESGGYNGRLAGRHSLSAQHAPVVMRLRNFDLASGLQRFVWMIKALTGNADM